MHISMYTKTSEVNITINKNFPVFVTLLKKIITSVNSG